MLNEIIYTRCGTGRDILKKGAVLVNEGYKCHSCSEALFSDGSVLDFQFLRTIAGISHPFSEPDFVDDAYLYYVPEKGKPLFQNFHPIPNSKGRAGNFISQIFAGDPGAYPCEAFGSKDWDAKSLKEDYYYGFRENAPPYLPQRRVPLLPGEINFEAAGRFIAQGRGELLKAAVWFLFNQYALPPEERKYLIVKDKTENIELWIAAIEYAFSPQIACTISFATRMAEAVSTGGAKGNRYFIGANGLSVALSEENPEKRLKAMIVGIDLKDPAVNTLRVLPAYPYCLLDGIQRTVSFNADNSINEYYYDLITGFNDNHKEFTTFLSSIPGMKVSKDIIKLCDAFRYLYLIPYASWSCAELIGHLELLMNYRNITADETPVKKIVSHIGSMLQKDEVNGYRLFDILRKLRVVNEPELCTAALKVFLYNLCIGSPGIKQSLEHIKKQPFAPDAFFELVSDESVGKYQELIAQSDRAQAERILEIYGEALKFINQKMGAGGIRLIGDFLERSIKTNDREAAAKTIRNFIHNNGSVVDIILPLAGKYKNDREKSELIWQCTTDIYAADLSRKDFDALCVSMLEQGFLAQIENLLCGKMKKGEDKELLFKIFRNTYKAPIPYPAGERFFREIIGEADNVSMFSKIIDQLDETGLDERVLVSLYDVLDKKLSPLVKPDSLEDKLERKLLAHCPEKADCSHSKCGILLSNIVRYSKQPEKIEEIIRTNFEKGEIFAGKNFARTDFCMRLVNETVQKLEGGVYHMMLLLLFSMPETAMEEYVEIYLDKAFSAVNKKSAIFFDLLNILLYRPGTSGDPLADVISMCGEERFGSVRDKIRNRIPLSYAGVFSEKINNNLQAMAAAYKNAELLDLFKKISAAAKIEYEKNHGGAVLGALKKLFGSNIT
jgi:hypothetical protein